MKKINYNSTINVLLTETGKEIYRKRYGEEVNTDDKGFSEFVLWIFMGVFGPYIQRGVDILEDGYMYMNNRDLEE